MKFIKIKKPDVKALVQKIRNLKREDIKAFYLQNKEKRKAAREKRKQMKLYRCFYAIVTIANRISLLLHVLLSCILNFVIEALSRHSVDSAWEFLTKSPMVFLYNSFLIFITFTVVYLVRRRIFTRIMLSVLWIILGVSNGYMLSIRVTPFNAQDLKVLGDGLSLIEKYCDGWDIVLVAIAVVLVIFGLVHMWRFGSKYEGKIYRIFAAITCVGWFALFSVTTEAAMEYRVVSNYFGNIAFAYEDYGVPYCFMASIFDTGIDEPYIYSEEKMMEITNDGAMSSTSVNDNEENPNIIFVQLESFFDPLEVEFLEMSADPIPNFRALADEYSSGYFKVPSVGAGTANTEFEVLTGMSMRYFGPGEYPYKTIMLEGMAESAATALSNLGYGTHALHNNGGNFYSRAIVYDHMGFDSYTCKEFMNILEWTDGGWAKDYILTEYINDAMDSTEGTDFVFAVSVEGHGAYTAENVVENPVVEVSGIEDEDTRIAWEYFVSLVYEMDVFVGELIESVEERDEPTVIVFYGDHLPTLDLEIDDLKSRYLYNTNYVIWDNIDLDEVDQNLASYQIMAEVFEQIGIESGTVFNYHQERRKTSDYLADLEILQYDLLYGEQYSYLDNVILAEEGHMQMGIKDVTLTRTILQIDGTYALYGTNFTNWSDVFVNGAEVKSSFVNDGNLVLKNITFEEGDIVTVGQVGSSSTVFRMSGEYEYRGGILVLVEDPITEGSWQTIYAEE